MKIIGTKLFRYRFLDFIDGNMKRIIDQIKLIRSQDESHLVLKKYDVQLALIGFPFGHVYETELPQETVIGRVLLEPACHRVRLELLMIKSDAFSISTVRLHTRSSHATSPDIFHSAVPVSSFQTQSINWPDQTS